MYSTPAWRENRRGGGGRENIVNENGRWWNPLKLCTECMFCVKRALGLVYVLYTMYIISSDLAPRKKSYYKEGSEERTSTGIT